MNATMDKFGYPETLLRDYAHWVLLLRPAQVTLGSLVLAAKSEVTAFADLPRQAFADQHQIIGDVEAMLRAWVAPQKINYLMLMMVDPHVHFHIFPRYEGMRHHDGMEYPDMGWPGPPDLKSAKPLESAQIAAFVGHAKQFLPRKQT